ncbi:MAG: hypothetical protein R3B54_03265 [Bdellovibrionota bacterium]
MRVPIALGALLFLFALRLHARYGDARLHISFLDVGQGDSALIQLPGGGAFSSTPECGARVRIEGARW